MDSDLEVDSVFFWERDVEFSRRPLNVVGTSDTVKGTVEFHEKRISDRFDLCSIVSANNWPDQLSLLFDQSEGNRLVPLAQSGITDHVSKHDCSESALSFWQLEFRDFLPAKG